MSHIMPLTLPVDCPACGRHLRVHKDFRLVVTYVLVGGAIDCSHNYERMSVCSQSS